LISLADKWSNLNTRIFRLDIGMNVDVERQLKLPINKASVIAFKSNEDFYYRLQRVFTPGNADEWLEDITAGNLIESQIAKPDGEIILLTKV